MTGEAEFAEVFLADVRIPEADLIGGETDGWGVAMEMLAGERGPYAVRRASVVRATLEGVYAAARERPVDPLTRDEIALAAIDLHVLDRQIDRVVDALAAGESMGPAAAMTKALLTRADQSVHAVAQKVLGPAGVAWSGGMPPWTDGFLYSRASSIYGGTAEIQRNIIGERLLGLPREPN
jgi:alkylation response protein AidB-like acyl-CoA dehydrogenase